MEKDIYKGSISVADFLEICRSCFCKRSLIHIEENILDLFKIIPDYVIDLDNGLPTQICIDCINKLKDISLFITLIKNNDSYLRKILDESKYETKLKNKNTPNTNLNEYSQYDSSDDDFSFEETKLKLEPNFSIYNSNCESSLQKTESDNEMPEELFKCNECHKIFSKHTNLKLHMRSHTKENPHQCKICHKNFRYASNLKRHDNIIHKGLKPFRCETCGKEFATLLRRTEHTRIHTGERPYICNMCGLSFKKYSTYYAHEQRHKIKNGLIPKSDKVAKKYPRKPVDPSKLKCGICQKIFSSKQALFIHNKIHSGEKPFLCTECGKDFIRKSHLEVHSRIHTGEKPYECAACGKYFRQLAVYRNHLLIHKNERSFKCQVCQKSFIQLGHLQNHLKIHTGEKPYKCNFCNKAFSQNGNLRAHTRMHTNERSYRCTVCFLGFYDSSSLKKHKKTHIMNVIKSE